MKFIFEIFLSLTILSASLGRGLQSGTKLSINYPEQIKSDNIIHNLALFGRSVDNQVARLFIHDKGSCDSIEKAKTETDYHYNYPSYLLIEKKQNDDLDCTYIRWTEKAQEQGYKGVLFMPADCLEKNNSPIKDDNIFKKWEERCDKFISKLPSIPGIDERIDIAPMYISRYEAKRLFLCDQQMKGNDIENKFKFMDPKCEKESDFHIQIEFKWSIPRREKVSVKLWTTALLNADIFVSSLWATKIMPVLDKYSDFSPSFFIWDGAIFGCNKRKDHCKDLCHNKGRYCHMDPPKSRSIVDIEGIHISQENLRQYCAYQENKDSRDDRLKWWKYVHFVASNCTGKSENVAFTLDCSKKQHEEVGLDFKKTQKCIDNSNGYDKDADVENTILEKELAAIKKNRMELRRLPSLLINDIDMSLDLDLKDIVHYFCEGLIYKKDHPCSCFKDNKYLSEEEIVRNCFDANFASTSSSSSSSSGGGGGVSYGVFFFILSLIGAGVAVAMVLMRKKFKKEMQEDVRNIMSEYVNMDTEVEISNNTQGQFNGNSRDNYRPVVALE